ncbi:MAG TPA: flagellar hook protein FlgE [Povalibacter sp.]|uniref:flagellar hook protein FlgE n=1 Tax=Povalibacter sp. TaxID=1962978 RepID=UPI002BA294AD|nr:flagellar hook protein FlgE [Povalibacter sp.]HMN44449.1 flagellar hook protein FlgE [Povalibacter sp.]
MSFGIALSGLNAAQTDLNVTANNIANSATNGFKQSRSEFAELFAVSPQGVARNQFGNGVKVAAVAQQFTQGNINTTNNSLDLAMSGQGFFVLSDGGATAYTRAGAFQVDNAGYVVNSQNQRLQVYPAGATGTFNTSTTTDLRLVTSESPPQATSSVETVFNLPANATEPTSAPFDPADPNSYNEARSVTIYDSLGAAHTASLYWSKTANANEWNMNVYVDGNAVGGPQVLQYSNTGVLTTPANGQIPLPAYDAAAGLATGAAPIQLNFDLSRSTQYGDTFGMTSSTQNGFTTGRLIGIDIDSTGVVQARFTNGRSTSLGQVVIANFSNPQGLQQLGNTNWSETNASGQPLYGQAGGSGYGLIQSGALEASNVDITAQLVNMITAQRNFQANAQMIQTADQVTQTIINIR